MSQHFTTDYEEIRAWVEEHGGYPAVLVGMEEEDENPDALHISFEVDDIEVEEIGWDEFFERFDNANLALVYDDEEELSFEFVDRDDARDEFFPDAELPDSGDLDDIPENIYPDAE